MAMDDVEAILNQMVFAFGAGAGTIAMVNRDALDTLRERWRPNVVQYQADWGKAGVATMVLAKFNVMGRLARGFAHTEGRVAIASGDVTRAVDTILLDQSPYC